MQHQPLRKDNKRDRFLSHGEAAALLKILAQDCPVTIDATALSLLSGIRASERLKLAWADINFEDGTIIVEEAKNTRNRRAHIKAETLDALISVIS